jgi:hypothetical protein
LQYLLVEHFEPHYMLILCHVMTQKRHRRGAWYRLIMSRALRYRRLFHYLWEFQLHNFFLLVVHRKLKRWVDHQLIWFINNWYIAAFLLRGCIEFIFVELQVEIVILKLKFGLTVRFLLG